MTTGLTETKVQGGVNGDIIGTIDDGLTIRNRKRENSFLFLDRTTNRIYRNLVLTPTASLADGTNFGFIANTFDRGYQTIASENGTFQIPRSMTITYRSGNARSFRKFPGQNSNIVCSNATFADPRYGHAKTCDFNLLNNSGLGHTTLVSFFPTEGINCTLAGNDRVF
jgi:hypothetical protein